MKKDRRAVLSKAAFTGVLVLSLTVGTAYADKNLNTVYQVYVDDESIGTVEKKGRHSGLYRGSCASSGNHI